MARVTITFDDGSAVSADISDDEAMMVGTDPEFDWYYGTGAE